MATGGASAAVCGSPVRTPHMHVWSYEACKHWYGGRTPRDVLCTETTTNLRGEEVTLEKIVVHTSSNAIVPLCLHSAELALVSKRPTVSDDGEPLPPPFESAALAYIEPVQHTMSYALPPYCFGKIPLDNLHRAIQLDERFCVWGIFDSHLVAYAFERGFIATSVPIKQKTKKDPCLNKERPRLWYLQHVADICMAAHPDALAAATKAGSAAAGATTGASSTIPACRPSAGCASAAGDDDASGRSFCPTFTWEHIKPSLGPEGCGDGEAGPKPTHKARGFYVLSVTPASDYIYHYARMVHEGMESMKRGSAATLLEVRRFPQVEEHFAEWTDLSHLDIQPTDLVIMGHVRDYHESLAAMDAEWPVADATSVPSAPPPATGGAATDAARAAGGAAAMPFAASPALTPKVLEACRGILVDSLSSALASVSAPAAAVGGDGTAAAAADGAASPPAPPEKPPTFAPWWRLFKQPPAVGNAAFQPPHEADARRLARLWAARTGSPAETSSMDFLLSMQQRALRNLLPAVVTDVFHKKTAAAGGVNRSVGFLPLRAAPSDGGIGAGSGGPRSLTQILSTWAAADACDVDAPSLETCTEAQLTLAAVDEQVLWYNYAWAVLELNHGAAAMGPDVKTIPIRRIFFLGARYSYWGNGIAPIARFIYSRTQYLLYGAKCGTLSSKTDIHKVVTPQLAAIVLEPTDSRRCTVEQVSFPGHSFLFKPAGSKRDHVMQDEVDASLAMKPGGQHVTVPTIVGETYAQRLEIDRAMAELRKQRAMAFLLTKRVTAIFEAADATDADKAKAKELRVRLQDARCLQGSREALDTYYKLALEAFPTNLAVKSFMDNAAAFESAGEEHQRLVSIDNETGFAAHYAGRVFQTSGRKLQGYFSAIHRCTDYVRRSRDAATITMDDLASEKGHAGERAKMIAAITRVLYKMMRRFLRFTLPVPTGMTSVSAAAAAVDALAAIAVVDGVVAARTDAAATGTGSLDDVRGSLVDLLSSATAASPTSGAAAGAATGSAPVRWGIIGAGNIAHKFYAAVAASGRGALAAVAKRDLQGCAKYVAELIGAPAPDVAIAAGDAIAGVKCYDDYNALLADADVDAVYIALPSHLHVPWALAALDARKHVLVEKPIASAAAEVRQIASKALAVGKHATEAMLPGYHPQLQAVRAAIAAVGPVKRVCAHYNHELSRAAASIAFDKSTSGGALLSLGCYPIAVAQTLLGAMIPSSGSRAVVLDPVVTDPAKRVDTTFEATLATADGSATVWFSSSIANGKSFGLVVYGERGRVMVPSPYRPGRDGPTPPKIAVWRYTAGEADTAGVDGSWPMSPVEAFRSGDHKSFVFGTRDGAPTIAGIADSDDAASRWEFVAVDPIEPFLAEVRAFEAVVLDGVAPQYPLEASAAAVEVAEALLAGL